MERLSTKPATQDTSACISLCYQLNQPISVQAAVDNPTAVAVQSLIDSQQVVNETQDEDEDIFQCGKCKKQFTSLALFVSHKQTPCLLQASSLQQQQPQPQQLTLTTGTPAFPSSLNLNRAFTQQPITGNVSNLSNGGPILQAHPCLTRTLNQPATGATLTLGGVPSSPLSQLSQNMVFSEELMALTSLDPNSLTAPTIQMVTTPIGGASATNQTVGNTAGGVTIFSPITSLAPANPNNFTTTVAAPPSNTGQLQLVQPAQQITLTTITESKPALQQQLGQLQHQQQQIQIQHQPVQQQQALSQSMPPPPPPAQHPVAIAPATQPPIQQQIFKPSPTKAGRKSAQSNFITVLNADNSVSLLSTRKGKTSAHGAANIPGGEDEANAKPKLQCEYCSKEFTKNFDLQQHLRAHTGEKPFQCIVCGRAFAQKSNVKKHMVTHKVWPCGTSNTLPKQPEPSEEPGDPEISRSTDGKAKVSQTRENDRINNFLSSGDETEMKKLNVKVDNSYICQYCPGKFRSYYQLKTHLVTHKSEQVYKCVVKKCGQSFHDLDAFLSHIKSHDNDMNYRCHQCHKYFKTLNDLGVHQYSHVYMNQSVKSGPRHFQCTKCGNKYTTPEALEHHMSTTTHDYRCVHCDRQFTCERFLRRHLPIHGSEGQFECKQCGKNFKTEHYLKSHHLIHTGETPFSCNICQAAFNRKDKLKRHMTIHDAVKKYRCPFRSIAGCPKEFNRPDKLKAHIITHSGIKPYKCSICGKMFSRRPHLLEHERGHNADYRFKCEKCGKGFFRPKLFNEHKCQPSKAGVEQHFRPRNRRKLGRPKKRMISITPDSIAKSRGKRYASRTRGKGEVVKTTTSQVIARHMSARQKKLQEEKLAKANNLKEEVNGAENGQTIAVEVVKALPILTATSVNDVKTAGASVIPSIQSPSGEDNLRGEILTSSLQQISVGPGGELVDHYVVHLTESVDGSAPTIQTAFIPASVAGGGQIFASGPGGIQPITIIEASSLQIDPAGAQILAASGDVLTSGDSNLGPSPQQAMVEGTPQLKLEVGECGSNILTSGSSTSDVMVGGAPSHSGLGSDGSSKQDVVMVMGGEEAGGILSVGGTVVGEEDMIDSSLALFPPPSSESYSERQVIVCGVPTYITCAPPLDSPGLGS